MALHVELKARVQDVAHMQAKIAALDVGRPTELVFEDTFFNCEEGLLKISTLSKKAGVIAKYRRGRQVGPRLIESEVSPINNPLTFIDTYTEEFGVLAVIKKHRALFLHGRTRIHLDHISPLGHFIELQVVLEQGENIDSGKQSLEYLSQRLGLKSTDLLVGGYIDLALGRQAANTADDTSIMSEAG